MWLQICRVIKNFIITIFLCVRVGFSCWIKPQLRWIKIIVRAKRNNKSSVQVWLVFPNGSPMYAISVFSPFSFSFCESWKMHSFECACVVFTGSRFFLFTHSFSHYVSVGMNLFSLLLVWLCFISTSLWSLNEYKGPVKIAAKMTIINEIENFYSDFSTF